jgi:Topoisomerase 6 subunit A/Spo11, Toprim domain
MKAKNIIDAVQGATKKWAKQRKREERDASARANRRYAMTRRRHVSIKDAAWQVMEEAYLKASANGTLPAHARQIMYAARGHIQSAADRLLGKDFDNYFTQTLLPDYLEENCVDDWNVVFDARGHFQEPHTGKRVDLGTPQVRNYLNLIGKHEVDDLDFDISERHYPTLGPKNAYGAILFIEKEGFMPLFEEVRLADRYDLSIMSTKGMSVTAARELVDHLAGDHGIPLLVLHDFDKAGFSILGTLHQDTRRYQYNSSISVIDLGLRLDDIDGLVSEEVSIGAHAAENLRSNGATEAEIEWLLGRRRVELNAMPSDQLVSFIERKLKEYGISKVVPTDETLADAYRRRRRQAVVQEHIDEALEELGEDDEASAVPADLRARIEDKLKADPAKRWDDVLRDIADHETSA